MTPSRFMKVRFEKKLSCPVFQAAKTVSGDEFSAIHKAASYLAAYSFEVKFRPFANIYTATAKMTRLKPAGAHFRIFEGELSSLVCANANSANSDPVIIQKMNEGERYHMK